MARKLEFLKKKKKEKEEEATNSCISRLLIYVNKIISLRVSPRSYVIYDLFYYSCMGRPYLPPQFFA